MGESLQPNRDKLYNNIKSVNPNYTKEDFNKNFKTKLLFDDFVNFLIKKKRTSKDGAIWKKIDATNVEQYYKTYGCDFKWAEGNSYCESTPPTPVDDGELKKLIGVYKSDQTSDGQFRIFDATSTSIPNSKFQLGIMSYTYSYISGILTEQSKSGNELILKISIDTSSSTTISALSSFLPNVDLSTLTTIKPTITFSEDRQSFTYDILSHKGTATKTEEKVTVIKKTNDKKTDNKKTDSKVEKPYKPHQTTLYDNEINYDKIEDDELKKLKNCGNIDFPFELYCQNKIIGDLNKKLFRSRRNDMYTELLQNYLTSLTLFGQDNLGKLLTRNVWNQAMKIGTIKESVKKVLKEYINKKK